MSNQITRRYFVQNAALAGAGATAATLVPSLALADEETWDLEADVIVVGSGGSGLPAALKANDEGASVIVVETNWDCGGHCMVSEGIFPLGGGNSMQKKWGVEDSMDLFYLDHTQGTHPLCRYNDRDFERAITLVMPEVYDYIQEKGVLVIDQAPQSFAGGGWNGCDSVDRWTYPDAETEGWVGMFDKDDTGRGVARPLERAARQQGIQFLMNFHMDKLFREPGGRVYGLEASYTPHVFPGETEPKANLMPEGNIAFAGETCRIKANKGVVLATGGSMGNLVIRTAYDPRLGPEFDGLAGMPYSDADGSGEIAAMEVGAILGDMVTYAQPEGGHAMSPAKRVGCRYVYSGGFNNTSVLWPYMVATGVIRDPDSMIIVNMLGSRCGNEDVAWNGSDAFAGEWFNTSLASVVIDDPEVDGDAKRLAGPLWAIFDQAAADRNDWSMEQGLVDYDNGYCFKADTLEELAQKVVNKYYEDIKMDPAALVAAVEAYNAACDSGVDEEWGRTTLVNKIETGPFYAAWATNTLHDCYGGIRVNAQMQAVDIRGNLIPGLFACGESAGGTRTHGLSRAMPTGYIAGRSAATGGESGVAVAAPEGWAQMAVYAGAPVEKAAAADTDAPMNDGTFAGTSSSGHDGPVTVQITVEGGAITAVEVTKENETESIGHAAIPTLCDEALAAQGSDIEAVSGATTTSKAFIEALNAAMARARA